ncbi:MAG: DUF1592 domain-containing protein [Nannocystaceae bacterium]|nr:DUF1592 domain-containing protein [Nannocystaceae bacterium]
MALHAGCYTGSSGNQAATDGAEGTGDSDAVDDGGGSDDDGDGGDDGVFGCTQEGLPETIALRRLSKVQYANTVADLIAWADADNAEAILAQAQSEIDQLPDDLRVRSAQDFRGGMRRLDQAVHQEHINQSYEVGRVVGAAMTTPDRIAGLVGACATDADTANDEQCIDDFIARFGERAHRRPLTDEELVLYREVFDGDGATQGMESVAFADVIQAMMGSPFFLYAVEHGEPDPEEDGSYRLSAYELASRLSYHFWQTMPDEALLASAASGELVTQQGYEAQVDRMLIDPRTRAAVGEFYRDWLWLEDVPSVAALLGSPKYDGFLDGMTPNAETTQNMRDEVLRMALYYTFDVEGGLSDLLTSDRIFPVTDDLAAIYGVAPWDGQGEPPVAPEAQRLGLLTRAGMLATGSSNSHPVLRGVFIRRALLCDPLPPPPADVDTTAPSGAAGSSTRQAVEALTEANAVCRGCHDSFNPLGFILEGFDAAGRFRTDERILHQDGSVIDTVPIDDTAIARVDGSDASEVSGAAELAIALADSGRVERCFARHYVRFTFAREEDLQEDACMIEGLSALATDQPLSEMLRSVAFTAAFRQRTFEQ